VENLRQQCIVLFLQVFGILNIQLTCPVFLTFSPLCSFFHPSHSVYGALGTECPHVEKRRPQSETINLSCTLAIALWRSLTLGWDVASPRNTYLEPNRCLLISSGSSFCVEELLPITPTTVICLSLLAGKRLRQLSSHTQRSSAILNCVMSLY